jgi:hypothetical protein
MPTDCDQQGIIHQRARVLIIALLIAFIFLSHTNDNQL